MTKIKICGIKTFEGIEYVNEARPDYAGFVFAKSRHQVDFNLAHLLKAKLDRCIQAVGVFVYEEIDFIKKLCDYDIIDMVQLHGDESEEYIRALKEKIDNPIILAVRVKDKPISNIMNSDVAYTLFDAYDKTQYGGMGKSFNWDMIRGYQKPFFLAGGLNCTNVTDAIKAVNPYCVDVSSGVETNGCKDRQKIMDFVNLVRGL